MMTTMIMLRSASSFCNRHADASCKRGQNGRAIQMLRLMEKYDCQPNVVVYSTIIDSLCKDQLVAEAFKLFSEMESKGIPPNVVTYTSLFLGLYKSCSLTEATQFFTEMSSKDVTTFNTLIRGLCLDNRVHEAGSLVRKMAFSGGGSSLSLKLKSSESETHLRGFRLCYPGFRRGSGISEQVEVEEKEVEYRRRMRHLSPNGRGLREEKLGEGEDRGGRGRGGVGSFVGRFSSN
ncbi:hypothetical protein L3X38_031622 [Prunus dulcis]|uniref:Pentatricopeptide repeat superfamily protein n=1 Tax=Prunus dulcis TaxID=3755 RepID=A0AAD4VCJ3_PRUDU|nr:hypothetical protein L3X38_031622 [Prunus dulcis]